MSILRFFSLRKRNLNKILDSCIILGEFKLQETEKDWTEEVKKSKKRLEQMSPKDRLDLLEAIIQCNLSVHSSTLGWNTWLANATVMKKFSKKELQEIYDSFVASAIQFLEFDIKWTKVLKKKKMRKKRKNKKDKTKYIS